MYIVHVHYTCIIEDNLPAKAVDGEWFKNLIKDFSRFCNPIEYWMRQKDDSLKSWALKYCKGSRSWRTSVYCSLKNEHMQTTVCSSIQLCPSNIMVRHLYSKCENWSFSPTGRWSFRKSFIFLLCVFLLSTGLAFITAVFYDRSLGFQGLQLDGTGQNQTFTHYPPW